LVAVAQESGWQAKENRTRIGCAIDAARSAVRIRILG
jgi:hypothetical protein